MKMFKDTKYYFYSELMETYLDLLDLAEEKQNPRLISRYSRKALKTGNKILRLENQVGVDPRGSVKPVVDILREQYSDTLVLIIKRD
jgi:hypothetical protein